MTLYLLWITWGSDWPKPQRTQLRKIYLDPDKADREGKRLAVEFSGHIVSWSVQVREIDQ